MTKPRVPAPQTDRLLQLRPLLDPDFVAAEIERLRRERRAVILAHNYQRPEVQRVADFVGDSLGLARQAARTDAEVIVFAGVHFMAETAAILNPGRTVLLPDARAGCSLADTLGAEQVRAWRAAHPGGLVVVYVNTSAAVKAEADWCVTSGNAVQVVASLPDGVPLLFAPDRFLAEHVARQTGRALHVWDGACHVHEAIRAEDVQARLAEHPGAELLVHPECGCSTGVLAHHPDLPLLSTEGMVQRARSSAADTFVVVTELDMVTRLQREAPDKTFVPVSRTACCEYMKMITLENVYESLRDLSGRVTVPEDVRLRALRPIERMLTVG